MHKALKYFIFAFSIVLLSCGGSKDVMEKNPQGNSDQFRMTFHEGMREKMIGNFDKAIPLFEKCLVLDPTSSAANFALSDIYEKQGDKSRAVQYAEKAYELDNTNKWYVLRLANLYYDLGHYHKSATYFSQVIANEKNTDLKFKYVNALIYSNQDQKAIDMLDELELELGKIPEISLTKHDLYMSMKEPEKAKAELDELIAENPLNIEYRIIVAEYFMNTSQFDAAQAMANEIIKLDETNGAVHIILADLSLRKSSLDGAFYHLQLGFSKADVSIERKLELIWSLVPYAFQEGDPNAKRIEGGLDTLFTIIYDESLNNDLLHSYYGIFLINQEKYAEAKTQFKRVIELNPDSYNAWMQLLNVEYDLKLYEEMAITGEKAIEFFPSQPMMYLLAGIGQYESGNLEKGEEWLYYGRDLVVQDDELLSEFLYHMGKVACLQKNYSSGYKYFEEAKLKYPNNFRVYNAKANFLAEEGKFSEAEAEIKIALDKQPINPLLLDTYGIILFKQKKYSLASEKFQKALMNDEDNYVILEHYGDALFLMGKESEAIEMWNLSKEKGNTSAVLERKITDHTYYEN